MNWNIKPSPLNGVQQSEIVLSFADFPGHYIGEYSDKLAAHLRDKSEQPVEGSVPGYIRLRTGSGISPNRDCRITRVGIRMGIRWHKWFSEEIAMGGETENRMRRWIQRGS